MQWEATRSSREEREGGDTWREVKGFPVKIREERCGRFDREAGREDRRQRARERREREERCLKESSVRERLGLPARSREEREGREREVMLVMRLSLIPKKEREGGREDGA